MKLKLETIESLGFDKQSIFNTILGFSPNWDNKTITEYISQDKRFISTLDRSHLKCEIVQMDHHQMELNNLCSTVLQKTSHLDLFFSEFETRHF